MDKKGGFSNWLINITLLFATLLFSLLVAEILVRHSPLADRIGWDRVPLLSERVKKFSQIPKKIKVVALGDSFTAWRAGEGVNMFDHVQRDLSDEGYAVLNLGWPGIDIDSYITIYKKYADFKPDSVVMCVYLGNDVRHYLPYDTLSEVSLYDRNRSEEKGIKYYLKKHSSLLDLMFRYGRAKLPFMRSGIFEKNVKALSQTEDKSITPEFIQTRIKQIDPQILEWAKSDAVNPWIPAIGVVYPHYYRNLFALRTEETLRFADETVGLIKEFREKEGIKHLLIVLIPESLQVSEKYAPFFKRCGFYLDDFPLQDRRKLTNYLVTKLTGLGIPTLDTTPALEKGGDVYLALDTHLNVKGQKIMGELIEAALKNDFESGSSHLK